MLKLILIFLLVFDLSAEECSRVNLARDKWALDYKNMPNYDQGSTNICYAYTAAQMVDYWKRTHNPKMFSSKMSHSSPLYAAYLFKRFSFFGKITRTTSLLGKPSQTPTDIGMVHSTIQEIRKNGMCNEVTIQESIKKFSQKMGYTRFDFFEMLYYFFAYFNEKKGELSWYQSWNNQKTNELRSLALSGYCDGSNPGNCKEANAMFDKIIPYFIKKESMKLYDEIFADCRDPQNHDIFLKKLPKPTTYTLRPASTVKSSIIKLLDRPNAQPIGIGYCMGILANENYVGLNRINLPKGDCGLHASIIIGKRTRNNRCEFLLKNTWGEDCSVYSKKWECELGEGIRRSRKKQPNRSFAIWMDAEALSRNIIQYSYF